MNIEARPLGGFEDAAKECPKGRVKPRRAHPDLMQFSVFAGVSTLSRLGGWNTSIKIPADEGGAFRRARQPSNYVSASPVCGYLSGQGNTSEAKCERGTQEGKQWGTARRVRGQPRWHFHKGHQRAIRGRERENLGLAGAGQSPPGMEGPLTCLWEKVFPVVCLAPPAWECGRTLHFNAL